MAYCTAVWMNSGGRPRLRNNGSIVQDGTEKWDIDHFILFQVFPEYWAAEISKTPVGTRAGAPLQMDTSIVKAISEGTYAYNLKLVPTPAEEKFPPDLLMLTSLKDMPGDIAGSIKWIYDNDLPRIPFTDVHQ